VLIPLLILLTTLTLFATAEIASRILWPSFHSTDCVTRDRFDKAQPVPNCSVKEKIPEGPWVSYDYNACGYRTHDPCGPKPPGTLRIAFLGSSITQGYRVPYENTFAVLTTQAVSRAVNRPVQNENLGYEGLSPIQVYHRVPEALGLHPDLVIYSVSPFDLEEKTDPAQLAGRNDPTLTFDRPAVTAYISPLKRVSNLLMVSKTSIVAEHFLYSNTEAYLRLSLSRGDKTDYMRAPLPPAWQERFADFKVILTDMAARFHEAGVPFVVVAIPSHQIGALLSVEQPPPHTDAAEFGRELGAIAQSVGVMYVDTTESMRHNAHSDRLFYLAESHLNGPGHAVVAQALTQRLQAGVIPALAAKQAD
jgi:hypothetical protein